MQQTIADFPTQPSGPLLGTVMVCWKEATEATRAVAAAIPLLAKAERVILASVQENDRSLADGLADLARHLAWHGISAKIELIPSTADAAGEMLIARAHSHSANLLVMGHGRARESVFGGFTRSVLELAEIPVFIMH